MFLGFLKKLTSPAQAIADQASLAYTRVREHWASCAACRGAAQASASMWCEVGLELMNRGIAEHSHWDTCPRCRDAQAQVEAAQCARGRELEREYRALARRVAD